MDNQTNTPTLADELVTRARTLVGEALDQPVALLALEGEERTAIMEELLHAQRLHPTAGLAREDIMRAGGRTLCTVRLAVDDLGEFNGVPDEARPTVVVLLEDAPRLLEEVARDIVNKRSRVLARLEAEAAQRDAERARQEERAAEQAALARRDAPFRELDPSACAALHVANELPAGELREAFLRFAGLVANGVRLGQPANPDPAIVALAERWGAVARQTRALNAPPVLQQTHVQVGAFGR